MSKFRECPVCLCGQKRDLIYRQRFVRGAPVGDGYDVVVCADCGTAFADGVPTQFELNRYYAESSKYEFSHTAGHESPYDRSRFETISKQLAPWIPPDAAILDVGCATGGLLAALKAAGYRNLLGVDPSSACVEAVSRLYGIRAKTSTLEGLSQWTQKFDVILLVGVLEHLRDVRGAVDFVARLLAPKGIIYCAQPDVEAFPLLKGAPFQQFSVEHINFFSRHSLTRLMAEEGLRAYDVKRWTVEWRAGVFDSVVSGIYSKSAPVGPLIPDHCSERALREYVRISADREEPLLRQIAQLVAAGTPFYVWGAGTYVRRLLATSELGRANIIAFVDSNEHLQRELLSGRSVISPADLRNTHEPILIGSKVYEAEILEQIRVGLKLLNPVIRV